MKLRLRIRVLLCAVFLFAAGLRAPADETPGQPGQPQAQQTRQANAGAAATAVQVPAVAVPAPAVPRIDDARTVPGFSPGEMGGLIIPTTSAATPLPAPQNRVLPANAGNVNVQGDSARQPANATSTPASAAHSSTWLIDGVRQLETESRQRNGVNSTAQQTGNAGEAGAGNEKNSAASASSSPPAASATANTDNPLAAYLDKWITTPEGAAAARAANAVVQKDATPAAVLRERANTETNIPWVSWNADTAASAQASPASAPAAGSNPYIGEMFQPQMGTKGLDVILPPPPILEMQKTPQQSAGGETQTPASGASPAPASVDTSKLIIKPITPPATAPVVDDKKYFPQLQRF